MDNVVLMKKDFEVEQLSRKLGFSRTLFLGEEFMLIKGNTKKEILSKIKGGTSFFYKASTEEMVRFVLEKTDINLIFGVETVHPSDSVHFVRSGLDPVLCKIAAEQGKIIGFSFAEIVHSSHKAKLFARMRQNIQLCRKYKVTMLFSTFAETQGELRSADDLIALWRILGGNENQLLLLPKPPQDL